MPVVRSRIDIGRGHEPEDERALPWLAAGICRGDVRAHRLYTTDNRRQTDGATPVHHRLLPEQVAAAGGEEAGAVGRDRRDREAALGAGRRRPGRRTGPDLYIVVVHEPGKSGGVAYGA